ncbi:MAG: VCBS repeat-containing protein [Phycisphaerales bacterium]|nr:VCBS repeat-containing protein [Phycisphaerales bacterium]
MRRWRIAAVTVGAAALTAAARDGCGPRLTIERPAGPGGDFGRAMAAIGDIDGDGWSDLAIGDPEDSTAGPHAGAVHLFSGRDGSLIRTIPGGPESATGWAVAACGDVNGDGVPDVLVGAPAYQPPLTNANTQPYKFRPAVDAMASQRVDFVCAGGDSNHFYGSYGFDAGVQMGLTRYAQMYATPIHSANENNGLVATRFNSYIFNSTGGPVGTMETAPPFFMPYWDVSAAPVELVALNRFAYWGPEARLGKGEAYGMRVSANHPIDLTGNLSFNLTLGTFAVGDGVLTPQVRLADPPYSHLLSWPVIHTSSPGGDGMTVVSNQMLANPGRLAALQLRVASPESVDLTGPVFLTWLRLENTDRRAGFSFSTLWAEGGKSARDAASFITAVPISSLTHFFAEARRLQGPDKKVIIYFNEGGNDRIDTRPSIHDVAVSWQPAGFRDNMSAVRNRIIEVWNANGWPQEELYFLMLGYHVLSDDPQSGLVEDRLIELRRVCRELAAEWPRSTCVDMSAFMTEAEALSKGWYTDSLHAHLRSQGYAELGRRIADAVFTEIAAAGSARVYSGVDGSLLFAVPSGVMGDVGDEIGYSVATGPDADGDGIGDFIVGAPARFNDLVPGRVYVCSGVDGTVIRTLSAVDGRDRFGESTALPGDLDGDALADPVVGNPDDRQVAPGVGSLTAWSSADGVRLWRALGGQGSEAFASTIAAVGDADFDGRADIIVGIPGRSRHGPGTGGARLYSGATGATINTVDGRAAGDRMGATVAALGDIDGDGRGDFAAGAPGADAGAIDAGQVRILGAAGLRRLADFSGASPSDAAGGVTGPGGVRPDDHHEVLVLSAGRVLVLDASGLCCTADLTDDGSVDFTDYLEFLNYYEAGDARVDFNADGLVDFPDYLEFLVRYEIGC